MRTNIVLDDRLIEETLRLSGATSMREAVDRTLTEFIARHQQQEILELAGQDLIAPDYDVRAVRRTMERHPG